MSFTCDQLVCYDCRHFASIISSNLTFWNLYCHDLNVTAFSVTKSQFKTVCETVYFIDVVKIFHLSKICVYVRLDFFFRWVFNNNEEEKIDKIVFCFLFSCKRTMKNSTSAKTHQIPLAWLYGTGGTWDKIELCLWYLGQDWTLPTVPGTRRRYRNRTLPWTLPPVPQVLWQLYGNQALHPRGIGLTEWVGYMFPPTWGFFASGFS